MRSLNPKSENRIPETRKKPEFRGPNSTTSLRPRNPKPEIRDPKEVRIPRAELNDDLAARASDFYRISDFGFRTSVFGPKSVASLVLFCTVLALASGAFAAEAPAKFTVSEFVFSRPADWQWIEVNSVMRKAQLKIVDADKKDSAEVIFFFFGKDGGGRTKENIDRWLSQFEEPKEKLNSKVEEVTIAQRKVTYVQAEGTYLSGMPGGPKTPQPNTMLLGAILESDNGNVFIRLTGPIKLAKASQPALRKMVEGALGVR